MSVLRECSRRRGRCNAAGLLGCAGEEAGMMCGCYRDDVRLDEHSRKLFVPRFVR